MTENKLKGIDRILSLSQIDGKAPISSTGLIDRRLFTGEQKLHAIMDTQTCLWYLRYDSVGKLPQELDIKFTTFVSLLKYVKEYFLKRNIKVDEVIE